MRGRPQASADAEDVALSAFDSFCRGAAEDRFPRLSDRQDLWELLVLLTARKICRLVQRERTQKRGGGTVQQMSSLDSEDAAAWEMIGREPTPDFAAQVADECRRLLEKLGGDELREVALAKMEGYTNAEIAQRLKVVERTVERRLGLIRKLWDDEEELS
jgi:DNA-directed RNA polymerase specialized sigma24 family protein